MDIKEILNKKRDEAVANKFKPVQEEQKPAEEETKDE